MSASTSIEWTDHTFNPWWGCARVSPGCERCFAEALAKRVGQKVWGAQAPRRFFGDKHWDEPRRWNDKAAARGVRERVFCASMADVFEKRDDLDPQRWRLWKLIEETPALDWLLLTKRPENADDMVPLRWLAGPVGRPVNVWFGCTAEDQRRADERIPHVLDATWPAVRFVSYEPALGPVDFTRWMWPAHPRWPAGFKTPEEATAAGADVSYHPQALVAAGSRFVDWIIVGGESGPGARPFNVEWAHSTVRACRDARVACFVKQMGARPAVAGDVVKLRDRKGGDMDEFPGGLRVREFPEATP